MTDFFIFEITSNMFRQLSSKRQAQSTLEYISLVIFLLVAFFVFQKYILQAFMGRWKGAGEIFGLGMRYAPGVTNICAFDYVYHNSWYNETCYDEKCDCFTTKQTNATCKDCILGCVTDLCNST